MRSSRGMTGRSIVFGATDLRSGRRLFATRELLDLEKQETDINLGESDEVIMGNDGEEETEINLIAVEGNENGINKGMGISDEEIKLGESEDTMLVDQNHADGTQKFRAVYTRKRKRTVESNNSNFEFEKNYSGYKRRFYSESGFDGEEGPIVFVRPSNSDDISSCIYRFSCFVSFVLRYMQNAKGFSWRHFSLFLLSDPTTSIYSSNGCRFPKDSIPHGFLKVFGSVDSIPFFTVDFIALPFCFLYMHSSLLLKSAFLSYAYIVHPLVKTVTRDGIKVPYFLTTDSDQPFGHFVVAIKARSARTRVLRVSVFKESFPVHVGNIVSVPSVREVSGYAEEEYVPFVRPESYISFRDNEVTRTLDKSYPVYEMDSDDEEWLKGKKEHISDDTFEKIIDALERGMYCSRVIYSNAALAVHRCLGLASKEVVQAVYRYWMKKRRRICSPLVRVFKCNPHKRGRKPKPVYRVPEELPVVVRKKRSFRGRNSQQRLTAIKKDQNALEETRKAEVSAHEAATRAETEAVVKRLEAQALMVAADRSVYRANMLLRVARLQGHKKKAASNSDGTGTSTGTGTGRLRGKGPRPMCVLGLRCVRDAGDRVG